MEEKMATATPAVKDETRALLAASKDLLTAAEAALARLQHKADTCKNQSWRQSDQDAYEKLRAAIAKATTRRQQGDYVVAETVSESNGPLLAASKDLLAAAEAALDVADNTDCDEPMTEQFYKRTRRRLNDVLSDAQDQLRAAIAKAQGK